MNCLLTDIAVFIRRAICQRFAKHMALAIGPSWDVTVRRRRMHVGAGLE